MKDHINKRIERINNVLLLNSGFIDNLGLLNGKMGICIYFFHLAKVTDNKIYKDFAEELIDEIYEEITETTPVNFENGLAGIGWGIEYLVQNGFMEADTDEVLEEFDNRIFKEIIYHTPKDISLLNGLIGLGVYFLKRIQNSASSHEKIPTLTNKQLLIHIIDELERRTEDIGAIIKEPCKDENNGKQSNRAEQVVFNITWDYSALLWFLAELYEQNLFNFKVEKIIRKLVERLTQPENKPKLHSNRLLLASALMKLRTTWKDEQFNLQALIYKLLSDCNRNIIKQEIVSNNTFLRHGTTSIVFLYQQLHEITNKDEFKNEKDYWMSKTFKMEEVDKGYAGFDIKEGDVENALGLFNGLAGIALLNDAIKQFNHVII